MLLLSSVHATFTVTLPYFRPYGRKILKFYQIYKSFCKLTYKHIYKQLHVLHTPNYKVLYTHALTHLQKQIKFSSINDCNCNLFYNTNNIVFYV